MGEGRVRECERELEVGESVSVRENERERGMGEVMRGEREEGS